MRSFVIVIAASILASLAIASAQGSNPQSEQVDAQEEAEPAEVSNESETASPTPLDANGNLVRFERDIAPILRTRCLKCHGPDKANADLRVDDPELLGYYIEPGDVESSILYTDHLTSADADTLMPPAAHSGPLPPSELALIRVWISEGANWPEDFQMSVDDDEVEVPPVVTPAPLSLGERVFTAIGYLHPVVIHFPIALFILGAAFVVLGLKWPAVGTQIPLACLLIGTVSAITAVTMGWSLAPTKGYGDEWQFLNFEREVDAHRWSAVMVTTLACCMSLVALAAVWKNNARLQKIWKAGLLACGLAIGLVGHQGGQMTYGRDFFPEMFRILTGQSHDPAEQPAASSAAYKPPRLSSIDR